MLLTLQHRVPKLKAKEQAFRFHALRDELQLLAVEGYISTSSVSYVVLVRMLNVAIRNPGLMRLRDVLRMATIARNTVERKRTFEEFQEDLQHHDPKVQQLASNCFLAFMTMLISNDSLVRLAFEAADWSVVRSMFRHSRGLLRHVVPTHTEAVDMARWYSQNGGHLAHC